MKHIYTLALAAAFAAAAPVIAMDGGAAAGAPAPLTTHQSRQLRKLAQSLLAHREPVAFAVLQEELRTAGVTARRITQWQPILTALNNNRRLRTIINRIASGEINRIAALSAETRRALVADGGLTAADVDNLLAELVAIRTTEIAQRNRARELRRAERARERREARRAEREAEREEQILEEEAAHYFDGYSSDEYQQEVDAWRKAMGHDF